MANSMTTDWDKFYQMVMGDTAPKAETPVRVTGEGLNVYQRPVVAIDSAGNPVFASTSGPPQGTKNNRGYVPSADNSLGEPWPGAYDQTVMRNGQTRRDVIRNIPAPPVQTAASKYSGLDTIDTLNPIDVSNWGFPQGYFFQKPAPTPTPAERAAAAVIVSGGSHRGRPTRGASPVMVAGTPRLATADPWASPSGGSLRIGPSAQRPGYATGTPVMRAASSPEPEPVMRARPITYDQPRVTVPGTAGSVNGVDMAFMPISVQTSSRWRTGY